MFVCYRHLDNKYTMQYMQCVSKLLEQRKTTTLQTPADSGNGSESADDDEDNMSVDDVDSETSSKMELWK